MTLFGHRGGVVPQQAADLPVIRLRSLPVSNPRMRVVHGPTVGQFDVRPHAEGDRVYWSRDGRR